ncbi:hypothetical protein FISHEDRAFT_75415 [Fistulina hepatica ATCC 64428]|uniref:Uncharacterized protein n=1 Tax=Fistulina hepatica ATCC 64428 TaxID=1128425 RepID=A0A0D7A6Q8_9AGAR|nr:hypothetical protein FISHEDRAFT_75415 [Fistulina hepatica ATCC 64428]
MEVETMAANETARLLNPTDAILSEGRFPDQMIHVLVQVPAPARDNAAHGHANIQHEQLRNSALVQEYQDTFIQEMPAQSAGAHQDFPRDGSEPTCKLAQQVMRTVAQSDAKLTTANIKRYERVEKMQRRIEKSVIIIILLDCPLEYKKGESQANIEIRRKTGHSCWRLRSKPDLTSSV